jgi:hypothetical protein
MILPPPKKKKNKQNKIKLLLLGGEGWGEGLGVLGVFRL